MKYLSHALWSIIFVCLIVSAADTVSKHAKLKALHERKKELDTQLQELVHERDTLKKKFDEYDMQRKQLDVSKEYLLKELGCHHPEHGKKNIQLHEKMNELMTRQEQLYADWDAYDKEREELHKAQMGHYYASCQELEADGL